MKNAYSLVMWIAFLLLIIGLGKSFILRPLSLLIPIIIIGIVIYFLKHPGIILNRNRHRSRNYYQKSRKTKNPATRRKDIPFKVIDGNKKDNDDDRPKYH